MQEQRKNARLPYRTEISIEAEDSSQRQGETVNISTGGVLVKTLPMPEFGQKLRIHLSLPGVPEKCVIPCIVRWINENQGAGLQFEHLRPIEVWAISRLKRDISDN